MMTVTKLKSLKGSKPFTSPIKVKVCGVGATNKYKTDKGEEKESTVIGLADRETAVKGILYDSQKLQSCKVESTIMLLNYIYKSDISPVIVITNKTKVMQTSAIDVPEEVCQMAAEIANPPPAECVSLRKAKSSPAKTLMSVKGKVVGEEIVKTVQVKGQDVPVKVVTIRDGSDDLKVCLWRDLATSDINYIMGKYVTLTDVVVNIFRQEVSASTTSRTVIQPCVEPSSSVSGDAIGFDKGDKVYSLMMEIADDFTAYEVPKDILSTALNCESDEEVDTSLHGRIPAACNLVIDEGSVSDMRFL